MSENKRIEEIDLIKGIGIILVVLGHSGSPFTHFIYLFHMAIFFIASGFLFKSSYSDSFNSLKRFTFNKIKHLWVPYVIWGSMFVLLHNFFIRINVYTSNEDIIKFSNNKYSGITNFYNIFDIIAYIRKTLIFNCQEQLAGAFWFFSALFFISVLYSFIDFTIKLFSKKYYMIVQGVISLIFLSIGFMLSLKNVSFNIFAVVLSSYFLFYSGQVLKNYNKYLIQNKLKGHIVVFIVSFSLLLVLNHYGDIELGKNQYINPLFLLASSYSGFLLLYSFSFFIKKVHIIKKLLVILSKNSRIIVVLHFLSMKIVSAIVVQCYRLPVFCIALFPNCYGDRGLWWVLYTIAGVSIPVVLSVLFKKVIQYYKNCIKQKEKVD